MRNGLVCAVVATALVLLCAGTAGAQLIYSFENGTATNPDGFGPNGGGVTIAQDTIGATESTHSMKVSVVAGATFVGALSGNIPAPLNDPPGVQSILFDMTIPQGGEFTTGFDIVGITVFGASQPGPNQQFGLQAQFAPFQHIDGKVAGTYRDLKIDLVGATHPTTFATNQTFNDIFGQVGSGPDDLIPTGFEFFINKSSGAPTTVYFDNVRVLAPEPASLSALALGGLVFMRRRRA